MADSHGQVETIVTALAVLVDMNCRPIYHIGDVCDSTRPETAAACLAPLRNSGVKIIKGNNDHAIVANHSDKVRSPVSAEVLQYLKNLPLVLESNEAILVHSLPFVKELGLSSMIGNMGTLEILRTLRVFPDRIIFRGHSHVPEIAWLQKGQITRRPLAVGEKCRLADKFPCVVTCGALTRGYFMVWDAEENVIECHSFG
jgi:predicted phosphodiesterase